MMFKAPPIEGEKRFSYWMMLVFDFESDPGSEPAGARKKINK